MTMNKKHTRTRRSSFSMGSERLEERRVMDASAPNFDLSGVEAETAYVGDPYSLDLMAAGGTLTEGDFTFTLDPDPDQTPAGATISADGVLNWTPSMDQVGSHTLRVIAMNSESPMKGDFESITIEVQVGSPVVDLNGEDAEGADFQTTYQFGQGPVTVADTDMTVADPNDETLMSATVTITNLANGEAELLTVDTEGTEITAEYAGGVLQLTGEASVEQYQQVLRSVRYSNTDPAADVTPRVIEFTVNDGVTESEAATSTININLPPDLAPIADQELDAGAELMFEISATDLNEADQLSFMIDPESPSFVSLIQEVGARTAQLMLTPGLDVTPGIFSVSILVFDNAGLADVESFFVEVAANEAPVSLDDAYLTNEDAALSVAAPGVLENDTDADGDPIAVTGVNGDPANVGEQITLDSGALLTLNADGSFDYDPNGAFASLLDGETAEDSFSYTIADSTGQESTANVTMTIAGVNTVPVSADDAYETAEDVALSISAPGVLENDADSDGDVLVVSEVNGESANVGAAITLDSGALLTLNADGSFDYDPNGAFASLAEGETAEDSFEYTATDDSGLTSTATVVIAINGVSNAPVSADDAYETTEDLALNISTPGVLENDSDADGDILTVIELNGEAADVGMPITLDSGALLTLNADGSFDYDPNGAFAALTDGETAEESFEYTASDESGLTSTATVVITVGGVNNAPVSEDDAYETTEDLALNIATLGVLENDADADGDSLSVTEVNGEAADVGMPITLDSGALLTLNADGSFDYDPNGAFASLAEGETAEESFAYTASDSSGLTSTANVVITISGVDHAPESMDDAYETSEDTALNISATGVLENDTDADGDSLTVIEVNGEPADVGMPITLDSGASLTLNSDGSFDYDPSGAFASLAEGETAEESFSYTVADPSGLTSTATVLITVNGIDHAPEAVDDVYETTEDTALNIAAAGVLDNDSDADGDSLTVLEVNGEAADVGAAITLDSGAMLTLNADGSFDYDPNGAFAALAEGESAEETFSYTATDSTGLTSTATVVITVTGVDHAPEAAEDLYETAENVPLSVAAPGVLANDIDLDGDTLSVTEVDGDPLNVGMPITLDSGALLTLNADGSFDYDPNGVYASLAAGETAEDQVAYTVADSTGLTSSSLLRFTITGVDNAPVAADDSYETAEDVTLNIPTPGVLENDADDDGDALTVSEVNGEPADVGMPITLDSGALLTLNADGSFDYDPNGAFDDLSEGETAEDSFSYTAADGSDLTSTATVAITINGVTNLIVEGDEYVTDEDSPLSLDAPGVLANDTGAAAVVMVNGEEANVGEQITLDSGALLTVNADGSFDYDPNGSFETLRAGESTLDTFSYVADDGSGTTDVGTVSIVINGLNDAPIAEDDAFSTDEATALSIVPAGVMLNDSDAEGTTLAIVAVNGNPADVGTPIGLDSGALLTLNADGSFDYDPNGVFDDMATGETATDSFTYTVSDGDGGEDTATVMLTINGLDTDNGTNRPPLNQVPGTQTIAAGLSLEFGSANGNAISVSDPDADGTFVQVTISVQHGILQLASLNAQRIMLVGSFEQISSMMEGLVYTPEDGFTGTDTFTINSNDRGATGTGNPRADIDTFDIVVTPSEAVEEVFADSEMVIDLFFG